MKHYWLSFLLFFNLNMFCQGPIVKLNFQKNLDIWKPYTQVTQDYINDGGEITSNTYSVSGEVLIFNRNIYNIYCGLTYQKTSHTIIDWQKTYSYPTGGGSSGPPTTAIYEYVDPLDLRSYSDQFGLTGSFGRIMHSNTRTTGTLSLLSEFYVYENYRYNYATEDQVPYSELDGPNKGKEYFSKRYWMPRLNISLNYEFFYFASDNLSIGAKVNCGTNLYSDWDQFSRYAWVGLGLEMGLGKAIVDSKE